MNSRQKAREELEKLILYWLLKGFLDEDIAEKLDCKLGRVVSIRMRNGLFKQSQSANMYSRIDDYKIDEKPIVGVKWEYQGHKYIDITGDIVDCGIAYKNK